MKTKKINTPSVNSRFFSISARLSTSELEMLDDFISDVSEDGVYLDRTKVIRILFHYILGSSSDSSSRRSDFIKFCSSLILVS